MVKICTFDTASKRFVVAEASSPKIISCTDTKGAVFHIAFHEGEQADDEGNTWMGSELTTGFVVSTINTTYNHATLDAAEEQCLKNMRMYDVADCIEKAKQRMPVNSSYPLNDYTIYGITKGSNKLGNVVYGGSSLATKRAALSGDVIVNKKPRMNHILEKRLKKIICNI